MGSPLEVLANYNPTGFALANQQRQAQLAQTQAQTAGIGVQTQTAQLENQLRIRNLKDMDIGQRAYANTDWTDPQAEQKAEQYMIQNGMSFQGIQNFRMNNATYRKTLAESEKDVLGNEQTRNVLKADAFNAYDTAKPEDKAAVWPVVANQLNRFGYNVDPNTAPPDQFIKAGIALNTHQSELIGNELKSREADEALAKTRKEDQDRLLAAQQNEREQAARAALPAGTPPGQIALTEQQREEMGIKGTEAALRGKELELQTKRLTESMDVRNRQLAFEAQRNARQAQEFDLNMRPLADPQSPLYGVDPKSAASARKEAEKFGTQYNNSVNAARDIQDFIQEARSGGPASKAAYSMLPAEGSFVISSSRGSRRINRNEVQAWAGAGSLLDRIKGTAGKLVSGASIDNDVLNSFEALHAGIAANALRQYQDNLRTLDQTYKTHFAGQAPAAPPTGGNIPTVTNKAQFDALPKGALFIEDGVQYRKP